jgi:hypothetical protein
MTPRTDPDRAAPVADGESAARALEQLCGVLDRLERRLAESRACDEAPGESREDRRGDPLREPREAHAGASEAAAPARDAGALAYRLSVGRLVPIAHPDIVPLASLLGVDRSLARLRANVVAFCAGMPCLDMLLYGDRGTGKSSAVRGLLGELGHRGLRLIEGGPEALLALPAVFSLVRGRPERFILYCDDVSFSDDEGAVRRLKAALDGGLEARPGNLLIAVTSNRRHLVVEHEEENAAFVRRGREIHLGETVHEKLSLSDRFGLSLPFLGFDQATYLSIVAKVAEEIGLAGRLPDEELSVRAVRFATERGGRSGRTARHACIALLHEVLARDANVTSRTGAAHSASKEAGT